MSITYRQALEGMKEGFEQGKIAVQIEHLEACMYYYSDHPGVGCIIGYPLLKHGFRPCTHTSITWIRRNGFVQIERVLNLSLTREQAEIFQELQRDHDKACMETGKERERAVEALRNRVDELLNEERQREAS